jgi:hypothetical protein
MGYMAVDEAYKERLWEWISSEAGKLAENPGDKGVNAFSRHSAQVLSRWGMDGLSTTIISKWLDRQILAEIKSKNLTRIGLLKGLSEDPKEAEQMAYLWLQGQPVPETPSTFINPRLLPETASTHPLVAQVANESSLQASDLQAIALAAINRLGALASCSDTQHEEEEEEETPVDTPLTYLLQGWLAKNGKTPEDLASLLGVSQERVEKILEGYPLSGEECGKMATLLNLTVDTLVTWGACPYPEQATQG